MLRTLGAEPANLRDRMLMKWRYQYEQEVTIVAYLPALPNHLSQVLTPTRHDDAQGIVHEHTWSGQHRSISDLEYAMR